jgi:transcriptional regulator with XRE-family HTH domain
VVLALKVLTSNVTGHFAVLCESKKARISKIEFGQANQTIHSLYKISKALDVHVADLISK